MFNCYQLDNAVNASLHYQNSESGIYWRGWETGCWVARLRGSGGVCIYGRVCVSPCYVHPWRQCKCYMCDRIVLQGTRAAGKKKAGPFFDRTIRLSGLWNGGNHTADELPASKKSLLRPTVPVAKTGVVNSVIFIAPNDSMSLKNYW